MNDIITIIATVLGVALAMKYFNKKNTTTITKEKAPTPEEYQKMTEKEKLNEWRKK